MVNAVVQLVFLRALLPLVLLAACVVRPCVFGLIYGILLLLSPIVGRPTRDGAPAATRFLLLLAVVASTLFTLAQGIFHITLAALPPYGEKLPNCEYISLVLRLLGLQRLDDVRPADAVRLIVPDPVVMIVAIVTYVVCVVLKSGLSTPPPSGNPPLLPTTSNTSSLGVRSSRSGIEVPPDSAPSKMQTAVSLGITFMHRVGEIVWLLLLCVTGVMYPSLLGVSYFLVFMGSMTYWATYHRWKRANARPLKMVLLLYAGLHALLLYLYQIPMINSRIGNDANLWPRVVGLTTFVSVNCTSPGLLELAKVQWPAIVNPILVFLFFWYTAVQLRWLSEEISLRSQFVDDNSSVHEELLGSGGESEDDEGVSNRHRHTPDRMASVGTSLIVPGENKAIGTAFAVIIKHAYVLALIFMMTWAVIYHSWLSLVFMILACFIWIVPHTRAVCLHLSPLILVYAEVLLLIQYIYSLPLHEDELPINDPPILRQLGMYRPDGAKCVPLLLKTFFTIPFWLTLRLFLRERYLKKNEPKSGPSKYGTFGAVSPSASLLSLNDQNWIYQVLVKYWIYVCILVLILVSMRSPVVAYAIVYMILFVLLDALVQTSWTVTRRLLTLFWVLLVCVSIVVLLTVYVYQFHRVPEWFHNVTGLEKDVTDSLGLAVYSADQLFVRFLTPISFLIVVVLQLKFFHGPFLRLTDMSKKGQRKEDENAAGVVNIEQGLFKTWAINIQKCYRIAAKCLWRFAEINWDKLLALSFVLLACLEPSASHFPLIVLAALMLLLRYVSHFFAILGTLWVGAVLLAKMLFQMNFVPQQFINKTCDFEMNGSAVMGPAEWAGFKKSSNILSYCIGHICVLLVAGMGAVICLRQEYRRKVEGAPKLPKGVMFGKVGRREADDGLLHCAMFLANYAFYKFGVEISFISTVVLTSIRMDGVAVVYMFLVLMLLMFRRRVLKGVWYLYSLFLVCMLPLQYASAVGFPPTFCIEYPWPFKAFNSALVWWLYFPSYVDGPIARFLIADFFQLLFVCCQLYMFREETAELTNDGGDNVEIIYDPGYIYVENPVADFITYTKSYLDLVKSGIFMYFHWITLIVVFIAGVAAVSLFALGYLLACFLLLWKGNELFIKPMVRVYRWWWLLLVYTTVVILLKTLLQVVGCVYWEDLQSNYCWLMQLFSIVCLRRTFTAAQFEQCKVQPSEAHIAYDAAVFAFLVFQLRILGSNYFRHVIKEFLTQKALASCGAYLINMIMLKEIKDQKTKEEKILLDIRHKMDEIKRSREEAAKKMGKELSRAETYGAAKRSGDYYMYEEVAPTDYATLEDPQYGGGAPEVLGPQEEAADPLSLISAAVDQDFDFDKAQKQAKQNVETSLDKTQVEDKKEEETDGGAVGKVEGLLRYIWSFFESILKLCSKWFLKFTRNYRWVAHQLDKEKRRIKEEVNAEPRCSIGESGQIDSSMHQSMQESIISKSGSGRMHAVNMEDVENEIETFEKSTHNNPFVGFCINAFYLVVSRTELLCYFFIILNQMANASLISLPLPLMAFFWGTLYAPRPPKAFWLTCITYVEALIVLKFIFQFQFFPWNHNQDPSPFFPPRIIGISIKEGYAAWDIALLMVLFYHRYMLRSWGLWKDLDSDVDVDRLSLYKSDEVTTADGAVENGSANRAAFELQAVGNGAKEMGVNGTDLDVESAGRKSGGKDEDGNSIVSQPAKTEGYCAGGINFFRSLLHPSRWYLQDLYSSMFLCDFICFIILVFGYAKFGTAQGTDGDVLNILKDNKVPLPFILMLLAQFTLIVIDRALYLRRTQLGKVVYHYVLVVVVHIWMFFLLPYITEQEFPKNVAAKLWYFVKCVYFLLSAWQIRSGYPTRILGNFLTKQYNVLNMVFFKIFMAIPFLFELRTIMDWIWTDTCMSFFDWFKMENIYAYCYSTKCGRKMEKDYPFPVGMKRGLAVKYGMGFTILLFVIIVIWLPLLLFSLLNTIGMRSLPVSSVVSIEIEGYPAIYTSTAQASSLDTIPQSDYNLLKSSVFAKSRTALAYMQDYTTDDILVAEYSEDSFNSWIISPPLKSQLSSELLKGNKSLKFSFTWNFVRPSQGKAASVVTDGKLSVELKQGNPIRTELARAINGTGTQSKAVTIPNLYFPYVDVPAIGGANKIDVFVDAVCDDLGGCSKNRTEAYVSLSLQLQRDSDGNAWWRVQRLTPGWMRGDKSLKPKPEQLSFTGFVSKVFPSALNSIVSGGIVGVYLIVVLAVGRMLRGVIAGSLEAIQFDEVPNIDYLLSLCLDIFLVREAMDFILEIELFAKLLFLFRSPATLIEMTRPKRD